MLYVRSYNMINTIFGAKSVTRFDRPSNSEGHPVFEERVVVLSAKGQDEAVGIAEAEAIQYAKEHKGSYLEWVSVYEAKESTLTFEGVQEIYSIMRHDDSSNDDYLDYFYDTGSERTTNFESK